MEFSRLTINNRKSTCKLNLTEGHGEKIKFGSINAIFLVTCEKSVEL